ncbi:MAG: amidohydrolase family protein [Pedococcus sp.]
MTPERDDLDRMLLTGRLVLPGGVVEDGAVVVEGDRISYCGERGAVPGSWAALRSPEGWPHQASLLPGLVDLHCHGGAGGEFGPDAHSAHLAVAHHHRAGTTSVVGSLVSAPAEVLLAGAAALAPLVASGELAGIHLEGPFLSMTRRGAQDPAALLDADLDLVDALVAAAGGGLLHLTFAPERDPSGSLPAALAGHGVLGALGHTDADHATCARALRAVLGGGVRGGLPLVTHLFNGMPPLHHRAPGPVAAALGAAARGEAVVELIADGVHLDGATVQLVFDVVGPAGIALVSDAMSASGLDDGDYTLGGRQVQVRGREARLAEGGSLAGGVSTLLDQVRWCVTELGIDLVDAVAAAALTPARALSLTGVGSLTPGSRADVLVVDEELEPLRVLRRGTWL